MGCPDLEHPARGMVIIDGGHSPGSVATYSCNGGLQLLGSPTRTCGADGKWSDEEPTCSNSTFAQYVIRLSKINIFCYFSWISTQWSVLSER